MESHEEEPAASERSSKRSGTVAQPDSILTVGSQRFAAILSDERDTGLHVLIQGSPLFWVEDSGLLETPEAEIAVRVSNIVRMESSEGHFASSTPSFRIGLTRLSQKAVERPPSAPIPLRKPRVELLSFVPLKRLRISLGGLVVCAMIVTPLAFVAAAWQHHAQQSQVIEPPGTVATAPNPTPSAPMVVQQPATPALPELTPEILRLPGVEPFLRPEVVAKLELTQLQTDAFGRLNQTTQDALADLEKYWESTGRLELARRRGVLLDAARHEALQLLTDRQRQQWEALAR